MKSPFSAGLYWAGRPVKVLEYHQTPKGPTADIRYWFRYESWYNTLTDKWEKTSTSYATVRGVSTEDLEIRVR